MGELDSEPQTVALDGATSFAAPPQFVPTPVRWLLWCLFIGWLFFVAWLFLGPVGGTELRDIYLYDGIEVLAVGLIAARLAMHRQDRLAWLLLAVATACWTAGDILYDSVVANMDPLPWPSIADAFYLVLYPCIFVALILLLWRRIGRAPPSVWIDALLVVLGVAAFAWIAVADLLSGDAAGSPAAILTNAAYPIGDFLTLSVLVGIMAVQGWPRDRMWWLLAGGCALMAISDSSYLLRVAADDYQPGSWLDLGWPTSMGLIAFAAWADPTRSGRKPSARHAVLAPIVVMTAAFGLLLYGDRNLLPTWSIVFAAGAILVGAARALQVFRQVSKLAGVRENALTDMLTGLGNRRLLNSRLDAALEARQFDQRVALVLFNVDGFRDVNDSFGHAAGDALLREVAARLRGRMRPDDTLARLGGDEFAVLLGAQTEQDDVDVYLRAVEWQLAQPFFIVDLQTDVAVRAGIAVCPDHAESREDLLRCADAALARAKALHGGFVFFDPGIDGGERNQLRTTQELREALKRRELLCHFQPKLDLRDGLVHSVEALVRWEHPKLGLLYPDSFLPLAEHAGLMRPLTDAILDIGLAQAAAWRRMGLEISVAVNLSMTNLLDLGLPDTVERLLGRHALPPDALVLEVTETIVMADPERAQVVVTKLHELGIALSVDDYGTGYSSLGQLRDLAAQEIKLDRAFVTGLSDRPELHSIVRSTVALAHDLGIQMVAEGIESATDLREVRRLGCDLAQGYYIRRPANAGEITQWLLKRRREHPTRDDGAALDRSGSSADPADETVVGAIPRQRHGPLRPKWPRRAGRARPSRGRRA